MSKGLNVIVLIIAVIGMLLELFTFVNLYAASAQEKMLLAGVVLTLVILIGLFLIIKLSKKSALSGKTVFKCVGCGCIIPGIVSSLLEWDSAESFFIWNIVFVILSVILSMAAVAFAGKHSN